MFNAFQLHICIIAYRNMLKYIYTLEGFQYCIKLVSNILIVMSDVGDANSFAHIYIFMFH